MAVPGQLNPLLSTAGKDNLASQLICEALMVRDHEGRLIPVLITEVPTIENKLLADDLTSDTYQLQEGGSLERW